MPSLSSKTKMALNWVGRSLSVPATTSDNLHRGRSPDWMHKTQNPLVISTCGREVPQKKRKLWFQEVFVPTPSKDAQEPPSPLSSVLSVPAMALSASLRAWSACRMPASISACDCRKLWRTWFAWENNKKQRLIRQQRHSVLLWKLLFSKPTDWTL